MKSFHSKSISIVKAFVLFALVCISFEGLAQSQHFLLKGVVFKNINNVRLSKVLVANLNSSAIVITDDLGIFTIDCLIGDTILFRQKDYSDQKIGVTTQNTIMVFMQPVINLHEVDIKEQTRKQELDEVMKGYGSQGVYNNGKSKSVLSAIFSPVNALYNAVGSGPRRARRFNQYASNELQQAEIDRRFNKTLIQNITGLKDEKLRQFVGAYKPSYEDIKKMNDYDLINYIKKSYADFEKSGESRTLPRLY